MYIPNITWDRIILKKCTRLPAVHIELGVLYFYLLNLATRPGAGGPGWWMGSPCGLTSLAVWPGQILSLNPHCARGA